MGSDNLQNFILGKIIKKYYEKSLFMYILEKLIIKNKSEYKNFIYLDSQINISATEIKKKISKKFTRCKKYSLQKFINIY